MEIQRVVTGHDKEGKSLVKWDSKVEAIQGMPGFSFFPMWATKNLPAELTEEDPNTWKIGTSMAGGSFSAWVDMSLGPRHDGIGRIQLIMQWLFPEKCGCSWIKRRSI